MLPKNSKIYIEPTSQETGFPEELVKDVVSFYYSTLRETLSELKHHTVQVEGLGVFSLRSKELKKLVAKYNKHLSVITGETYTQMTVKKDVEESLEKVLNALRLIKEESIRKKEAELRKQKYKEQNGKIS